MAKRLQVIYDEEQAIYSAVLEGTSEDDLSTGLAMGTGRLAQFCRKAVGYAPKHSDYITLKSEFTLADFIRVGEFDTFWKETFNQRQTIANQVTLIEGLYGRDMTSMSHDFHTRMQVDKNAEGVKVDYDDLHSFFSERADVAKNTRKVKGVLKEAQTIIEASKKPQ